MKIGRFFMSLNGDSCRLTAAWRRLFGRIPERDAVRDAVLLAQRGHETLIEQRRGVYRAVIIDRRAERDDLRLLTRIRDRSVFTRR